MRSKSTETTEWPPERPENFEFSPHKHGWARWYRGQSRVVTLKSLDRAAIRNAWKALCERIDAKLDAPADPPVLAAEPGDMALVLAADRFFAYLAGRVDTGQPKPMSRVTADDYRRVITDVIRRLGPTRTLASLAQDDFSAVASAFAGHAPTTLYRVVAYVRAFFAYCVDEGLMDRVPRYGRTFVKPTQQSRRDSRMSVDKSMDPVHVGLLFDHARPDEKCWIVAGLCGALDNADVASLTWEVLDRDHGVIDYRRRKVGKVRRVIPMPPAFWQLLERYSRPEPRDPADGGRVFLTPEGLPLQRRSVSDRGVPCTIDYVNMRWSRLMVRAGLRPPMPRRRDVAHRDLPPRTKRKGVVGGQGFRALRTTFPNLAPPGFRDEVEIVMGHSHGAVLLDNYLERVGLARLRELVNSVFSHLSADVPTADRSRQTLAPPAKYGPTDAGHGAAPP